MASQKVKEKAAAFMFGLSFLIALLVLPIFFPNPTPFQYTTFRIILSLAASGVAALVPGVIDLNMGVGTKNYIRAGGALAVLVLTFFANPAQLVVENPPSGPLSQLINVFQSRGWMSAEGKKSSVAWQTAFVTRREINLPALITGIIKPKVGAEVRVGARAFGMVERLHVNIGDSVEKGDLLVELDSTEFKAMYDQAIAHREVVLANRNIAESELNRMKSLFERNLVSRAEMNVAEKTSEQASASLDVEEANVKYAKTRLEYTKIRAPISGVVASIAIQEGETVAANLLSSTSSSPSIVTIIDLQRLEVKAYVDESNIDRIHESQVVAFMTDAYSDIEFEGKVTAISPQAEVHDGVTNYGVIVEITNYQGKTLRPGMTTALKIGFQNPKIVLTIPQKALRKEGAEKFVYILKKNQPERQRIITGGNDESYIEIIDGLKEGDKIIIGEVH